jgi:hypothetical protein
MVRAFINMETAAMLIYIDDSSVYFLAPFRLFAYKGDRCMGELCPSFGRSTQDMRSGLWIAGFARIRR